MTPTTVAFTNEMATIGPFSQPGRWPSSQPNTENFSGLISKSGQPVTGVQLEILLLAYELLHNTLEVSWTALTTMKTWVNTLGLM